MGGRLPAVLPAGLRDRRHSSSGASRSDSVRPSRSTTSTCSSAPVRSSASSDRTARGRRRFCGSVAGLLSSDSGSIVIAGAPAGSEPARASSALVPDEPTGFDELSGAEFVALAHALWRADEQAVARSRALAHAFGLEERLEQGVGTLSRGLRRQVSAVAALSLGTQARARRRGNGHARPRGGGRARRGAACALCARCRRRPCNAGSPLRRSCV